MLKKIIFVAWIFGLLIHTPVIADQKHNQASDADSVKAVGVINSVAAGKVNISHEPIPAIGWPAMTMDMAVSDTVELNDIQTGNKVNFTLIKGADGIYMIDSIKPAE